MEHGDSLVDTNWLGEHLNDPNLRVVDIRGYVKKTDLGNGLQRAEYLAARDEYGEAHIPGAVFVDWTCDITEPEDPVPAQIALPDRFAALMGSLGIGDATHVVVYDHSGGQFATRLWWALLHYGHDRVSVLDGGWEKWTAEDRPATAEVPAIEPAVFTPRLRRGWRKEAEDVLTASEYGAFVLDARDKGQYTGAVAREEGRPPDSLLQWRCGGDRSSLRPASPRLQKPRQLLRFLERVGCKRRPASRKGEAARRVSGR